MIVREDDPAIMVQWYFADPGAKTLTQETPFRSANWVNRFAEEGELGEQPGDRKWRNGKKPKNGYTGDAKSKACAEFHSDWWTDGLPEDEESGPYNENGIPICCILGPSPPPIAVCDCSTSQSIRVTLHSPANPCIDGVSFGLLWDESLSKWTNVGSEPQPCGDCYIELDFVCVAAFPTQWLLSVQFKAIDGGPASGCAGGTASINYTNCLPIMATPFQFWSPDFGVCDCTNGIVSDSVTADIEEVIP